MLNEAKVREIAAKAQDRDDLINRLIEQSGPRSFAELGVWRGESAEKILAAHPGIDTYYMINPWRSLEDWNKPFNQSNDVFEEVFAEACGRVERFGDRARILRGRTIEVIDQIPQGGLDGAYIDGDHTARGILIDLVNVWDRIKPGGIVIGDDLSPSPWQHDPKFEPTLVFPLAVYFAEAVGAPIYCLPHFQFVIVKPEAGARAYQMVDVTDGLYARTDLSAEFHPAAGVQIKGWLRGALPQPLRQVVKRILGRK